MYSQLHYIFFGCLLSLCGLGRVNGFGVQHHVARKFQSRVLLHSTAASESTDMDAGIVVDDKQLVKLFGRLAEKYIMLDASGGMCCYSACKDCEFRLPDGGYIMADQSASRPKWIPCYDERTFESSGKSHITQWSQSIFGAETEISQEDFVSSVQGMDFVPPLTNKAPYVSASAAKKIDDTSAIQQLYQLLAKKDKDTLTLRRMQKQMKVYSKGEEGWTWKDFYATMTFAAEEDEG